MNFTQFVFNLSTIAFFIVFGIQIYKGCELSYALLKGGIVFGGILLLSFLFFTGAYLIFSIKPAAPEQEESQDKKVEQKNAANN